MITPDFPSNSKSVPPPDEPKNVESVVSNEVVSRKKSLGKRFRDVLIGGDSTSVFQYVVVDVIVPQVKDMITEAVTQGFERLVYGEGRSTPRRSNRGASNYTNYNSRYTRPGNNPIGRAAREERTATASVRIKDIDDILLATRIEAETVLERLGDLIEQYEMASVADLYSLIDWTASHVDQKWGWYNLSSANIQRVREGYILNLPKTQPLD